MIKMSDKGKKQDAGEPSDKENISNFWKKLWKVKVPHKVRLLAWRAFHDSLPIFENLKKRGLVQGGKCWFCGFNQENSIHLFKECWWASALWNKLGIGEDIFVYVANKITDWIWMVVKNCNELCIRKFLYGLWTIWHCRNLVAHGGKEWDIEFAVFKIKSMIQQWDSFSRCGVLRHNVGADDPVKWKLYCDGAWSELEKRAGIAGILVSEGQVTNAFAKWIDQVPSSRDAEGLALKEAMAFTDKLNCDNVVFLTDALEVVELLSCGAGNSCSIQPWMESCQSMLLRRKGWFVSHICREENLVADLLARKARRERWSWEEENALPICIGGAQKHFA